MAGTISKYDLTQQRPKEGKPIDFLPGYLRVFVIKLMHQLDSGLIEEYKMHNHPVGACQITIIIDKTNNRTQECKRLRPLFY